MTRGIHLVWTTYGTWLPGDDRGHWSPLFTLYGMIRQRGGRQNDADLISQTHVREVMKEPPKVLDDDEQAVVAAEIGKLVQPPAVVAWAAAVERTHVHLLVGPIEEDVSTFTGRMGRPAVRSGCYPGTAGGSGFGRKASGRSSCSMTRPCRR